MSQCPLHPLNGEFKLLPSERRLRQSKANRMNNSVITQVTKVLNSCDDSADDLFHI